MKAIQIKTKDGKIHDIDPVIQLTIDNSYHEYDFDADDIESIEVIHE